MLRTSVTKFNDDLNQLSSHIKSKQTSQIRQTIKNKAYTSAGMVQKIEPKTIIHPQSTQPTQPVVIQEQVIFHQPSTIKIEQQLPTDLVTSQPQTSSHMTLNRLNAQEEEEEMDDGSFQSEVKIETGFSEVS